MKATVSTLTLPGSHVENQNPFPFFRARNHAKPLSSEELLPEEQRGFGYETAFRVLPYTMQDVYQRAQSDITLKTVVLENDCLRATFLCEYGGRLYSLFDKTKKRELLYTNPVLQPANLAIRNAWFSGGIEWNVGHFGHTFLTCEPVFFARCREEDGTEFLRMYEYERCKGAFLQIDFHLPRGVHQLYAHVKIQNSHKEAIPMYWWTNIAVEENRDVRVFSGSDQVIYIKPETIKGKDSVIGFGHGTLPLLEPIGGQDATHPDNMPYSCEYFFQNGDTPEQMWEVAAYNDGTAFWERSTAPLRYRKMFCWGSGRGGRHWQSFLSKKGSPRYLEIQAGICPSQVHGCDIEPEGVWRFTQAFGGLEVSANNTFGPWQDCRDQIYQDVDSALSQATLYQQDKVYQRLENVEPEELLHLGSGWGSLEALREPTIVPAGLVFPQTTLGAVQQPWRTLLETGDMAQEEMPASWMVDCRWIGLVKAALDKHPENSTLLLHYGIMRYENDETEAGIEILKNAYRMKQTPVAAFCLAQAIEQAGDLAQACALLQEAVTLCGKRQTPYLAEYYLRLHVKAQRFQDAWAYYEALPKDCKADERVMLEVAPAAYEMEQWSFLETLFTRKMALVREGEIILTDLWFRKQAHDWAQKERIPNDDAALAWVMSTLIPPEEIDFRMSSVPAKK